MLSDDQKRAIAEQAALATRMSWGRVNPRTLGELTHELAERAAQGTLSTPTFSEYLDAQDRTPHAEKITARDERIDALLDGQGELRDRLKAIARMQGAEGIVSFGREHCLNERDAMQLIEEREADFEHHCENDFALGD